MQRILNAACECSAGLVREHNEDNFLFADQILPSVNQGLEEMLYLNCLIKTGLFLGVFDGVGGEKMGEMAAFAAAKEMRRQLRRGLPVLRSEKRYLDKVCQKLNEAVFYASPEENGGGMYTTMAGVYFGRKYLWICNVGDSRVMRLRNGVLETLSCEHTNREYLIRHGIEGRKPHLIQYLGINPTGMKIEPHITAEANMPGDRYLLCSDGLTDMLHDDSILQILSDGRDPVSCVRQLTDEALAQGGKDNLTVIVFEIE